MNKGLKVFFSIIALIAVAALANTAFEIFSTKMQKYYLVDDGR